jgi:hypothetical protein
MTIPNTNVINASSANPIQYVVGSRTFTFQAVYADIRTWTFKLTAVDTNLSTLKKEYTFELRVFYICLGTTLRLQGAETVILAQSLVVKGSLINTKTTASYTHGINENNDD